jgi:hypothetical protein
VSALADKFSVYIPKDRAEHFAHRASTEEVFEVFENKDWPFYHRRIKTTGPSPAYVVYGRTMEGRYLMIPGYLMQEEPLKGFFVPATVREMTADERKTYKKAVGR